jgi:hypothetical protein
MKNVFSTILLLIFSVPSLLIAKNRSEKNTAPPEPSLITLAELAQAIETGMPLEHLRNIIIECPQGAELPLKMTIRGDVMSLEPNLVTLKLLKTCYIKSGTGSLLFSSDRKDWKTFSNYFIGKGAASLDFQNQIGCINLELELNQNKNRWETPLVGWKEPRCYNQERVYIYHLPPNDYYKTVTEPTTIQHQSETISINWWDR